MTDEDPEPNNVVPLFGHKLRLVSNSVSAPVHDGGNAVVDHDGHSYLLVDLLADVPAANMAEVTAAAPRSNQQIWDEIVRRWPALADNIASSCRHD